MKKTTLVFAMALAGIITLSIVMQSEARSIKFGGAYTSGPDKIYNGKTSWNSRTLKVKPHPTALAPKPVKRLKRMTRKKNCCRTRLRVNDNLIWGAPDPKQNTSAGVDRAKVRIKESTYSPKIGDKLPIRARFVQ